MGGRWWKVVVDDVWWEVGDELCVVGGGWWEVVVDDMCGRYVVGGGW